jgi:thymidylate synthase
LQSIWCRLTDFEGKYELNANVRFRSNDAWGAAFMNMFGITMFINDKLLKPLELRLKRDIEFARLNWQADSYHIYGKDQMMIKSLLIDKISDTTLEDRTWNFSNPDIQEIWNTSELEIKEKIKRYDEEH